MSLTFCLSVLLVTTFVAHGLISLWAASSQHAWYIRTGVILFILSPLLYARAYELFVILLLQSASVAGLVRVSGALRCVLSDNRRDASFLKRAKSTLRISMSTLIIGIGLAAVLFALANRLPELNRRAWQSIVLVGCAMGTCSAIPFVTPSSKWFPRILISIVVAAWMGILLALADWMILSFTTWAGWPPDVLLVREFEIGGDVSPAAAWFAIAPCVCLLTLMFITALGLPSKSVVKQKPLRFVAAAICISVVPIYGLWVLVRPPDFVSADRTNPADIKQIIDLSQMIEASGIRDVGSSWDTQTIQAKQSLFDGIDEEINRLQDLLTTDATMVVDYSPEPNMNLMMSFRATSIALCMRGKLALEVGDRERAASCFMDAIRLGYVVRSGGLLIDAMIGIACSHDGLVSLYESRMKLSPWECQESAREILKLAEASEGVDAFILRDRGWVQVALGWYGRMFQALEDVSGDTSLFGQGDYETTFNHEKAVVYLVATELALSAYQTETGNWPVDLKSLVPTYLPEVLVDPLDPGGGKLRYGKTDDGYVLYSVGENGSDDGGIPPETDSLLDDTRTGDLILESYFANQVL